MIEDRERKYDRARLLNLQKTEMRWQNVLEEHLKAEARDQHLADGSKGSANRTSVAYDTISLEYFPTQQGQQQKYLDDLIKYKAGVRAETLHRRGAGQGYNPITGEEIKPISIPSKPRDPGAFHCQRVEQGRVMSRINEEKHDSKPALLARFAALVSKTFRNEPRL